jgi:pentatricopeptide repeat protein
MGSDPEIIPGDHIPTTLYSSTANVLAAEGILNEILEADFKPNVFVLTSLIRCYGKAGRTDDVVRSFGMFEDLGISPDDRFCGCLLRVAAITQAEELGKVINCIEKSNAHLGAVGPVWFCGCATCVSWIVEAAARRIVILAVFRFSVF